MAEGEDKTSNAVKELEGKMKGEKKENYYVRQATKMLTTAKETRLVEDDTQDTFLKGEPERLPATSTDFRVSFLQGLLVSLLPSYSLARVVI